MTVIKKDNPLIAEVVARCDASPDGLSIREISNAMGLSIHYTECLMRAARISGGVVSVRHSVNSYRWMTPAGIAVMKSADAQPEHLDGKDCWPISRNYVSASDLPPPQTRAIKWIFDAGVSA